MLVIFFALDTAAQKKSFDCVPSANLTFSALLFGLLRQTLIASLRCPADSRHFTAREVALHPKRIMVACEISCRAVDRALGCNATLIDCFESANNVAVQTKQQRSIKLTIIISASFCSNQN